jgi:hypothetical protein
VHVTVVGQLAANPGSHPAKEARWPFSQQDPTTNASQNMRYGYQKYRTGLEMRLIASKVMKCGVGVVFSMNEGWVCERARRVGAAVGSGAAVKMQGWRARQGKRDQSSRGAAGMHRSVMPVVIRSQHVGFYRCGLTLFAGEGILA